MHIYLTTYFLWSSLICLEEILEHNRFYSDKIKPVFPWYKFLDFQISTSLFPRDATVATEEKKRNVSRVKI